MAHIEPYYERDGITIYVGDNREVLPQLDTQVHAVCTDPPYGLSFMGKGWDHSVPGIEFWQAISAAMLPGAHLLAFGGTRTYHRMAVAIEDAGYEIRDTLQWIYATGFPKSHDVSKAIDKMAGAEREVVGSKIGQPGYSLAPSKGENLYEGRFGGTGDPERESQITAPATPAAEQWQGWGTALKPAYEPIIMARLPFKSTVAANVLQHGTGAINVDASRIPGKVQSGAGATGFGADRDDGYEVGTGRQYTNAGRWPANVILDEAAAEALDAQSGERPGMPRTTRRTGADSQGYEGGWGRDDASMSPGYGDTGGASRFFYVAKSSRRERNAGLEGMPERPTATAVGMKSVTARNWGDGEEKVYERKTAHQNTHPTVKPLALMRYLIQMVTPPGGIVLDPFMGSGSTLVAAAELGFDAIGIELSEEYAEIAARRVDHALNERGGRLPLEGVA